MIMIILTFEDTATENFFGRVAHPVCAENNKADKIYMIGGEWEVCFVLRLVGVFQMCAEEFKYFP